MKEIIYLQNNKSQIVKDAIPCKKIRVNKIMNHKVAVEKWQLWWKIIYNIKNLKTTNQVKINVQEISTKFKWLLKFCDWTPVQSLLNQKHFSPENQDDSLTQIHWGKQVHKIKNEIIPPESSLVTKIFHCTCKWNTGI